MAYTCFLSTFLAPVLFPGSPMCVCVCACVCVCVCAAVSRFLGFDLTSVVTLWFLRPQREDLFVASTRIIRKLLVAAMRGQRLSFLRSWWCVCGEVEGGGVQC